MLLANSVRASGFVHNGQLGNQRPKNRTGDLNEAKISCDDVLSFLCIQRQAAAVGVLLSLFRLSILAFEKSERHVERFVTKPNSDGVHRHALLG